MAKPFSLNGGIFRVEATEILAGVIKVGPEIPITLTTGPIISSNLDAFILIDDAFNVVRSAEQAASDTYQAAMQVIYEWLLSARKVLAIPFGDRWSPEWVQAGFITPTTAIPSKIEKRYTLLVAMIAFFAKNPDYEATLQKITAAQATLLKKAVDDSKKEITRVGVEYKTISDAWTVAYDNLAGPIGSVVTNLADKLSDTDPRWVEFGLPLPGTRTTPGQPQNVAAHLDSNGLIIVQCPPVALSTRYRCRMLIVGVETGYTLVGSSKEPMISVSGIEPGQTVQIIMQAVNGNLQSVASEPILFTVLIPAHKGLKMDAVPVASIAMESKSTVNRLAGSNGNGNGAHAVSHRG